MKKLLALFYGLIFLTACSKDDKSGKILPPDKMFNLLIDMHLADASLDYTPNVDTMLMKAKSKYTYIFNKNNTDSATFSYNLDYYSKKNNKEFVKIYTKVIDSLERLREKLIKVNVPFGLPLQNKYADSIYLKIKIPYIIDSVQLKAIAERNETKKDTLSSKNTVPDNAIDTLRNDTLSKINRRIKESLRRKAK